MKEIRDIIAAYEIARTEGQAAALATVVSVEGSSYRQAGARMLITEDGCMTGAISGGCLEGDALRKARLVMERGVPKLVRYDTNDEGDAIMGLGLGCKGIIEVLIEPIDAASERNAISLLEPAVRERRPKILVTHAATDRDASSFGTCLLLSDGVQTVLDDRAAQFYSQAALSLSEGQSSLTRSDDGIIFCELLQPELRLLIFGAGNDAIPLTKLAAVLGWEPHVIDGRPSYATGARFPQAASVGVVKAGERVPGTDSRTVAVLMSHNYNYDMAMLQQLLSQDLPYIGTLGPRRKLDRMLLELGLDPECPPPNLHGPTGLDIGASTPEEIALSIVAEIQSVISRRSGEPLRERNLPIHAE